METAKDIANKIVSSDMIKVIEPAMGIRVTYDKNMLLDIERYICTQFNENHKPLPTTCIMFGILLGETIIRNVPDVKWDDTKEIKSLYDLTLVARTKSDVDVVINPVVRIENFFKDKEDSIVAMYVLADLMSNYDIMSQEFKDKFMNDDGWVTTPDGYTFRFRPV